MHFNLESIDRSDAMRSGFLSALLKIDRSHITHHMERMEAFDIEIIANGRYIQPDVLIRTMLAEKDREIIALKQQIITQNTQTNGAPIPDDEGFIVVAGPNAPSVRTATRATPVRPTTTIDDILDIPAPLSEESAISEPDIVVTGDRVTFKRSVFKDLQRYTGSGLSKALQLVQDVNVISEERHFIAPEEILRRLSSIYVDVIRASQIIERIPRL